MEGSHVTAQFTATSPQFTAHDTACHGARTGELGGRLASARRARLFTKMSATKD